MTRATTNAPLRTTTKQFSSTQRTLVRSATAAWHTAKKATTTAPLRTTTRQSVLTRNTTGLYAPSGIRHRLLYVTINRKSLVIAARSARLNLSASRSAASVPIRSRPRVWWNRIRELGCVMRSSTIVNSLLALTFCCGGAAAGRSMDSAYTKFAIERCPHRAGRDVEDYGEWRCQGLDGITVLINAGDQRMT